MTTSHLTSKHATLRGLLSAAPRRTPVVDATLVLLGDGNAIVSVVVQDFQRIACRSRSRCMPRNDSLWRTCNDWSGTGKPRYQVHPTMGSSARTPGRLDRLNAQCQDVECPHTVRNRYDDDDDRGETGRHGQNWITRRLLLVGHGRSSERCDSRYTAVSRLASSSVVVSMMTVGVHQLDLKEAHCLICAWRVRTRTQTECDGRWNRILSWRITGDGTLVGPIDESEESADDDEQDIVPSSMTGEGRRLNAVWLRDFETQDMESAEDPVDQLMALQNRFWQTGRSNPSLHY